MNESFTDDDDPENDRFDSLFSQLDADQLYAIAKSASDFALVAAAWNRRAELQTTLENAKRAESVKLPLKVFSKERGLDDEDTETQISDLLCNALHLCDQCGGDGFVLLRRAIGNYAAELVCADGLGPDLLAGVTLNGAEPCAAVRLAKREIRLANE